MSFTSIGRYTLDKWFTSENPISGNKHIPDSNNILIEHYEMPRKLDWNVFKRIYDIHAENYEQLISINGVGPATVRALSLIGELIYGTKASWQNPVKYNFAHGGKDGVLIQLHERSMINQLNTSLLQSKAQR